MSYPLPFERLSALGDTLIIGPGVESVRFRIDDPTALPTATQSLVIDGSGYFGTKAVPAGGVGDVTGPGSSTDSDLATFSGTTGKVIQDASGITALAGALGGVLSIDGLPIPATQFGDVVGPAGATDNTVATYSGATGKLIQDTTVTIVGGDITGVTTINGSSPGDVVGPASATDTALAIYSGATGKLIENSTVTLSPAGVLAVNTPAGSAGIVLPNLNPSTGATTTLAYYAQQNLTTSWLQNGSAIAAGQALTVSRIGNVVFITVEFPSGGVPQAGAPSNAISTNTAVAAFARPSSPRTGYLGTYDSGASGLKTGYWVIDTGGIIYMYAEITNAQPVTQWSGVGNTVNLATAYHTGTVSCANFSLNYTLDP